MRDARRQGTELVFGLRMPDGMMGCDIDERRDGNDWEICSSVCLEECAGKCIEAR